MRQPTRCEGLPSPPQTVALVAFAAMIGAIGCIPEGPPTQRARPQPLARASAARQATQDPLLPAKGFADRFDRRVLGPAWRPLNRHWVVSEGRVCAERAKNRGLWLRFRLPKNVRITFDAVAKTEDGDLKFELFGDGSTGATKSSYKDASGYVGIFGGWHNRLHVLAKHNEHASDRRTVHILDGNGARKAPVEANREYHFEIRRRDGETLEWLVDGVAIHRWRDPEPLVGSGHDHFGFNNWSSRVCFDNLSIVPLPAESDDTGRDG